MTSLQRTRYSVTYDVAQIVKAGLVAGAALLGEHIALWHPKPAQRLTREQGYIIGTATLGAAYTWWALGEGEYKAAAAFWLIAALGGAPVAIAYAVRRRLEARDRASFQAGAAYGEAVADYAPPTE